MICCFGTFFIFAEIDQFHLKQTTLNMQSSIIPSVISTSMGGAVIGGSIAHISGALVGGLFGIFIALCSEYQNKKTSSTSN
ncbi:hypothetical protein Dfer_5560 [Dyadobacter fermentans DSM 18053]|uniref:Uncharacterized protein n=2 Tax=Dyadobacter fermentans TaxID=94254 RepID=C6VVM0_DYAFD|nr:hypothetical protein Dfer_5560 [Dyadobacter fermentans DSM 18053]